MDVTTIPELLRITQDAVRSRQPVVLTEGEDEVAIITPIRRPRRPRASAASNWEEIHSLQGIAGSLPTPMPWEEVERIAAEDRADELQRRGRR